MSRWRFPASRLLVFARAPVTGRVKTRLQPLLGAECCLELYRALLQRTMATVGSGALAPVHLWVDQDPHNEEFLTYCNSDEIFVQPEADLGRRMAVAAGQTLLQPGVESVILLGSDCPAMTRQHLQLALQELESGKQVVITPAEDGGYVLLGLRQLLPELFSDIAWGGEDVFNSTLQRCADNDIEVSVLPGLWDVDRPEDLPRLAELDSHYSRFLGRG